MSMGIYELKTMVKKVWRRRIWKGCSVVGFDVSIGANERVRVIWDLERWQFEQIWMIKVVIEREGKFIEIDETKSEILNDIMGLVYNVQYEW